MSTQSTITQPQVNPIGNGQPINPNEKEFKNFDDLKPEEIEFGFQGRRFILREASHGTARRYRSKVFAAYTQNSEGNLVPTERLPETETTLVAGCCFEITSQGNKPVTEEDVITWPNRATTWVFDTAKKISMLTDRDLSSPESIQREIERLTKLLQYMNKDKEDGGEAGNLPNNSIGNSS
jgi:hypothetical protein